ncbi:hypothetical protein [Chlorogloeopsis sp. ULAP02]|uniref:hypothetical protein n=1 Tax=Chlorogloeopsis sp. ULAP02 TaxID=3107926 RepID=UPI0031348C7C
MSERSYRSYLPIYGNYGVILATHEPRISPSCSNGEMQRHSNPYLRQHEKISCHTFGIEVKGRSVIDDTFRQEIVPYFNIII